MSDIKRIEPGARMSEAVIHGGKVYTCGIVAVARAVDNGAPACKALSF